MKKYIVIELDTLLLLFNRPDVSKPLLENYLKKQSLSVRKLLKLSSYKTVNGLFKYIVRLKQTGFIKDNNINKLDIININSNIYKILKGVDKWTKLFKN